VARPFAPVCSSPVSPPPPADSGVNVLSVVGSGVVVVVGGVVVVGAGAWVVVGC
jgi:hypothetical protein